MDVLEIVVEPLVFKVLDGLPFQSGTFRGWNFPDKLHFKWYRAILGLL